MASTSVRQFLRPTKVLGDCSQRGLSGALWRSKHLGSTKGVVFVRDHVAPRARGRNLGVRA